MTSFVGRGRELTELRGRLGRSRMVTLTGAGGVGKTRLAIELAHGTRRGFADGAWFVDLSSVTDPAEVPRRMATVLGIGGLSTRPSVDQLADFLAGRELLLVLDNCEHHVTTVAVLADALLSAAAGLRVVATSRESLGLVGESIFVVPPLSVPDPDRLPPLEALPRYESIALFCDRAAAGTPHFALTAQNLPAVARLCAGLDGIPFAIELAVARLRVMSVEQLADRLAERFRLLTGGSPAAQPRQRTLLALVDWSFELCTPRQRTVWIRASAFADGFDLAAAEAVCAGPDAAGSGQPEPAAAPDGPIASGEVLDLLGALVAQSVLMVTEPSPSRLRYRMLATIRQYGQQKLADPARARRLRDRHRDHYLSLAERTAAAWSGPGQPEGLATLRVEHGNLRGALEHSVASGDAQATQRLASALRYHWCCDGFLSEGREWLGAALRLGTDPTPLRARTLWAAAWAALLQGDHPKARDYLDECATLADDHHTAGYVASLRGTSALFRGELDEALRCYEAAVAGPAEPDEGVVLLSLFQLAMVYAHRGDGGGATAARAVAACAARGEQWSRSYAYWAWGFDAWLRGEWTESLRRTREALLLQRDFDDRVGAALMIELVAWTFASRSDVVEAGLLLGAVRAVWHTIGTSIAAFGPHLARHHAHAERRVLEAVRAERFQRLLEQGGALDPAAALDRALGTDLVSARSGADAAAAAGGGVLGRGPGGGREAERLTPRERQVAALLASGLSNRRIAAELTVSVRTVEHHVEHVLAKLGFGSRTQVASWAARQPEGWAGPGRDG